MASANEIPGETGPGTIHPVDLTAELARLRATGRGAGGRCAKTLVNEADLRVVLVALRDGARLDEHRAPGPITIPRLAGRLHLRLGGRAVALPAGGLIALERGAPHAVEALEDGAFLLTIGQPDRRVPSPLAAAEYR